jgi:hypothetical protein
VRVRVQGSLFTGYIYLGWAVLGCISYGPAYCFFSFRARRAPRVKFAPSPAPHAFRVPTAPALRGKILRFLLSGWVPEDPRPHWPRCQPDILGVPQSLIVRMHVHVMVNTCKTTNYATLICFQVSRTLPSVGDEDPTAVGRFKLSQKIRLRCCTDENAKYSGDNARSC